MKKKVLMIAFHFPPDSSIGAQRTFKTAEYLPEFGWDPIILTAKPNAYEAVESSQEISESLREGTFRTAALDVHRHLSINGKHFEWMKTIDRWSTWIPGALIKGISIIRRHEPDVIWSTCPIPSAHIIARTLSKKFDLPWVVDYRDPMNYHHFPVSKMRRKVLQLIDRNAIENCNAAVFTTPGTTDLYRKYFYHEKTDKFHTIENGFDEKNWHRLASHTTTTKDPITKSKFSLLYSGVIYADGRDPVPLFEAIKNLNENRVLNEDNFELIFQGAGDGSQYEELLQNMVISKLVKFTDSVPYLDSLLCLSRAEALVIIQDEVFNLQIPGKIYEYIRAGKPILVITPDNSSTARAAENHSLCAIVQTREQIASKLRQWIEETPPSEKPVNIESYSRLRKTSQMADLFSQVISTQ